jgi:arsenate reductase
MSESTKKKILFLCTGNSCRSQMGEGFANTLQGEYFEAYSAGVNPSMVNPRAAKVMAEMGINIADNDSNHVNDLMHITFDYVITVCDHAAETCPVFPGKTTQVIHHSFDDPPHLAKDAQSEEEALGHFRRVRDEIKAYVDGLPRELGLI